MKPVLEKLDKPIEIVLDASTLSNQEIYDSWVSARESGKSFVIAINAAVLYSVHKEYGNFAPIAEAYRAMASSIVFHNEDSNTDGVVLFDLSKREVLTSEVLAQAITKLTSKEHYKECDGCPLHEDCVVTRNRVLLSLPEAVRIMTASSQRCKRQMSKSGKESIWRFGYRTANDSFAAIL